jgi:lipopolysaccharide transport system ATP-binding protein
MSDYIIKVEHLSKRYTIRHQNGTGDGLRHAIHDFATAPLRWLRKHGAWSMEHGATNGAPGSLLPAPSSEEFWALRGVSFEVKQGEVVGIIGRNGAGKSTLLKILSRITEPTEGRVRIRGRVASLLEVGTGFHPELTGRENIYLSAALFGLTTPEIRALEGAITEFAELGDFIDAPIKNYSSGMHLRLGFSIAAQLQPDIFLLDEVLSVGDEHFQQKCLRRLEQERLAGRTFVVVTHSLGFVEETCDRAALLMNGRVVALGSAKEVTRRYRDLVAREGGGVRGAPAPRFPAPAKRADVRAPGEGG